VSDTGAPWNLPYPLPTDLVRDGADAIKDLAEATATGLSAAGNAGIGSNVVQAATSANFDTTSTSFVDVTNLEVAITPSSATSKVLLVGTLRSVQHFDAGAASLFQVTGTAGTTNVEVARQFVDVGTFEQFNIAFAVVVEPASASAVTYRVQVRRDTGTGTIRVTSPSRLIAIEVAA
jgi:hypothetical protein